MTEHEHLVYTLQCLGCKFTPMTTSKLVPASVVNQLPGEVATKIIMVHNTFFHFNATGDFIGTTSSATNFMHKRIYIS